MRITLLCNAGLALETENAILLVDTPNENLPPFCSLPEQTWQQIYDRIPPYDRVCGLWFTHDHPDHCDRERVMAYHARWPQVPVFLPEFYPAAGKVKMGPFVMQYRRMDHAPIENPPIHVVTLVTEGERWLYLPADAELDIIRHGEFLQGRHCDAVICNSMYLSRSDTRALLQSTSDRTFIYHMPPQRPDSFGLWKKLERNWERFGGELKNVIVLDQYPITFEI